MKSKVLVLPLLLSVLILSGCASGPTFKEYSGNIPDTPSDLGRIYIYRTATVGAMVQPGVKINGEVAGKAVPRGFFFVDRPEGSYEISASTETKRSLTLRLEAGDEKYVRLEVKMGLMAGHIKPVLVENSIGKAEIVKTKYTGN